MDRAAIEELFTFTDYSWREHELVIRPLGDEALTRAGARLRLAGAARCPGAHQLGVHPLARQPGRDDR
jgi:hypothetical protein